VQSQCAILGWAVHPAQRRKSARAVVAAGHDCTEHVSVAKVPGCDFPPPSSIRYTVPSDRNRDALSLGLADRLQINPACVGPVPREQVRHPMNR
jgi:hypothetical protein